MRTVIFLAGGGEDGGEGSVTVIERDGAGVDPIRYVGRGLEGH